MQMLKFSTKELVSDALVSSMQVEHGAKLQLIAEADPYLSVKGKHVFKTG